MHLVGGWEVVKLFSVISSLTFRELKSTFDPTESDDEFIAIFDKVQNMAEEP